MTADWKLMAELESLAVERYGGHFTVLRFTTNWRVAFTTVPTSTMDGAVRGMSVGKTFAEAAQAAIDYEKSNPGGWWDRLASAAEATEAESVRVMTGR
jgi:hypothetical protein